MNSFISILPGSRTVFLSLFLSSILGKKVLSISKQNKYKYILYYAYRSVNSFRFSIRSIRMGRQLRLVLLLVISLVGLHLSQSSALQPASASKHLNDDIVSNELISNELTSTDLKSNKSEISNVKKVSDETLEDLKEAAKHSVALAEDPHFNKMLPVHEVVNKASSSKNSTDDNYLYDDDYDYDLNNYDSSDEDDSDSDSETTTAKTNKNKTTKTTTPKLHPIEESTSVKPKVSVPGPRK